MAKRKLGWGPSNPLWRWQHRKVNKKPKRNRSIGVHMPKRRYRIRRSPRYYRRSHKRGFPSIASIMSVAGPQVILNSGQLGSYPAIPNALSGNYKEAGWNFAANEIMAFTGYDVGKGGFNIQAPLLTYGMPLAIRFIRKFVGRVKAGPVTLF